MAETTTEEETTDEGGLRSQFEKHEAFVQWANAEFDIDLDTMSASEVIAWFAAKRNQFRKSEGYLSTYGPEAREAAKAERTAAKEKAAAERAAAKEAKAAEKAAAKEAADKAKAAEGDTPAKATKPASKASKRTSKKAASEDEAF